MFHEVFFEDIINQRNIGGILNVREEINRNLERCGGFWVCSLKVEFNAGIPHAQFCP
jgi:hypothetical protein